MKEEIENCKTTKEDLTKLFDELGKKGVEVSEKKTEAMVSNFFSLMNIVFKNKLYEYFLFQIFSLLMYIICYY